MIRNESTTELTAGTSSRPAEKHFYQRGESTFIVENHQYVRRAVVVDRCGEFYTLRIGADGGIRLRAGRLFRTKADAEKSIQMTCPITEINRGASRSAAFAPQHSSAYRSHYDYDNSRCPYGM